MKVLMSVSTMEQLLSECGNPEIKLKALREFDDVMRMTLHDEIRKAAQRYAEFERACEEERIKCQRD